MTKMRWFAKPLNVQPPFGILMSFDVPKRRELYNFELTFSLVIAARAISCLTINGVLKKERWSDERHSFVF